MTERLLMSEAEFEAHKEKLAKVSLEVIKLARLVLVENLSQSAAAAAVGMSRQNASKHMKRVHALLSDVPAGWVQLEAQWMPAWLAEETRLKVKAEHEKIKNV